MSVTLSDVLQALGFSELIEQFEREEYDDVAQLLKDSARVKEIVPEEQLAEFQERVKYFFDDNSVNDGSENDEGSEVGAEDKRSLNLEEEENHDFNNIRRRPQHKPQGVFAIENVNVKEILESTFEGRQILSWHQAKSYLTTGKRKRFVHFVIAGVLNIANRPLYANDFKILSQKIVDIFPKECSLVYYEPGVPKTKSDSGQKKKPKLLNKYTNLKKLELQLFEPKKKQDPLEPNVDIEPSDDIKVSIEWLQNEEEPWVETVSHWKITAQYRHNKIDNTIANKIKDIYENWPILKCARGYELILEDFILRKFGGDCNAIKDFRTFFTVALSAKPVPKDEHCKLLLLMLEEENVKEDNGTLIPLMLLCIMLPSVARVPVGKKKWKPSSVESLEGIVTKVKSCVDIDQVKVDRQLYAKSKRITVQPYIIVVEEDDYAVEAVYICIDEIIYAIPSLLQAVDVCFKAFHVFNAKYTIQSEQIWLMLQLGLYKFRTKWDASITSVNEILNDMGYLIPLESEGDKAQN